MNQIHNQFWMMALNIFLEGKFALTHDPSQVPEGTGGDLQLTATATADCESVNTFYIAFCKMHKSTTSFKTPKFSVIVHQQNWTNVQP